VKGSFFPVEDGELRSQVPAPVLENPLGKTPLKPSLGLFSRGFQGQSDAAKLARNGEGPSQGSAKASQDLFWRPKGRERPGNCYVVLSGQNPQIFEMPYATLKENLSLDSHRYIFS